MSSEVGDCVVIYSGHVLDVGQHLKFEVVSGVSYFATLGDEALG